MVERTSIRQPAVAVKRFKNMLTHSSSAVVLAALAFGTIAVSTSLPVASVDAQNRTSAVVPISEDEFINPTGLGLLSSAVPAPYEIEEPYQPIANQIAGQVNAGLSSGETQIVAPTASRVRAFDVSGDSTDMAALDSNIPGMHTPALPASMNPALRSNNVAVSASASASGAQPLPAAFLDTETQNTSEFQSASLSANRVEPSSNLNISDDLVIPPVTVANNLPAPSGSVGEPSTSRVEVSSPARNARTSPNKDLAFVTRKLDSVGINSQKLRGRIGTGLIARPDYIGSNESKLQMIPVIDIEYKDRVFVSTERGIGVKVFNKEKFDANVFGTWRRGRDAEGDIKTFQDRDGSVALGLEIGSSFGPFRVSLNSDYGVSGDIKGAKSDLDLTYSQAIGSKFNAKFGLGLRGGDSTYIDSLFGVSASDVSAGAPTITQSNEFSAGLVDIHTGIDAAYFLTPNISLNLGLGASMLTGEAAKSQIVEELGSKTQWNTTVSTQFKF
ncbi:MAG: MipA/OmpV family protein [Alphaproteobacteria bacterium]